MQTKIVQYTEWKPETRNQRVPFDVDAEVFRGSGIIFTEDGTPVAAIMHLEDEARKKAKLLGNLIHRGISWNDASKTTKGSARTSGIRYANQTFGTTAPQAMRRRYGCRYATFHEARPDIVQLLGDVFYAGWEMFQEVLPEQAEETWKLTTDLVHDDWRFADTPWTSGIINDIVSLPYHRDSGNIPGTWSAMLVVRKDTDGSMLHLPEYNVALECGDMSMMYFNGQAAWHGVTPMRVKNSAAYRRSMVMYSKSGCKDCGPKEEEANRAAAIATKHDVLHDSPLKKREQ